MEVCGCVEKREGIKPDWARLQACLVFAFPGRVPLRLELPRGGGATLERAPLVFLLASKLFVSQMSFILFEDIVEVQRVDDKHFSKVRGAPRRTIA